MRGSIRQRGTTYTAYWFTNDPATGKRRQHSKGGFPTKKTAGDHLTQVLPKVADGSFVAPRRMTVEDYFNDEWLPAQRERGLRPTTLAQYEVVATKWIIPHIGGVQLGQVNPSVVQQAYETLRTSGRRPTKSSPERTGLGSRSVQRAAVVLKMALEHAVRQGVLARNAASLVSVPRVTQREMSTWASEQSREFLEHTGSDPLFAAWALFLCRGLRRGEVAGLRWENIDLNLGRLRIVHTRVVGADNRALSSTPKTDQGRRSIPLDAQLVRALQKHQVHQKEHRLAAGDSWANTGYVFVNELGEPFHPDHFSARFQTLAGDLGLPKIRLHDARHTAASLMLANGTPTKVAQEILGHARPSITQDMYQHVMPGMAEEAGEALSASLLS